MDVTKGKAPGMPNPENVSTKRRYIAELARRMPDVALHSLSHHIDLDWLHEAHRLTRKDGSPGVDGQTGRDYEENLERNLESLLRQVKTRKAEGYRAPPVRRVYIPKSSGGQRPIGLQCYGDKVLQRSVAMVLENVYEESFHDFSYGFRPGRSQHQALRAVRQQLMAMGGGWVLQVDIRSFFDAVPHNHIQAIVRQRIQDGLILRLIGKWLRAGVVEKGIIHYPTKGTPQGSAISPILTNVFLHEVVDDWFVTMVRPRMHGACFIVRFADDIVLGFRRLDDAQRVLAVLPRRLAKYGLNIHPDKTQLVRFERPSDNRRNSDHQDLPEVFDFLGFTHFWSRTRRGFWAIKRKTAKGRLKRSIRELWEWLRAERHQKVRVQHELLKDKLVGHYQYFGIRGNYAALAKVKFVTERMWRYWLARRSEQRIMPWARFKLLLERYPLPRPRIVHTYV